MKTMLKHHEILRTATELMSCLTSEVQLEHKEDGWVAKFVDPANVVLCIFKMPRTTFEEYDWIADEKLAFKLDVLKQILKRAKSADVIEFANVQNKLDVTIKGATVRRFSISLVEYEGAELKVPELAFEVSAELESDDFEDAISDLEMCSETSIKFAADTASLVMTASDDLKKGKVEFNALRAKVEGEGSAKYSIEYLSNMTAAKKLSSKVVLRFKTDYPVMVDYAGKLASIKYILAPRVDTE